MGSSSIHRSARRNIVVVAGVTAAVVIAVTVLVATERLPSLSAPGALDTVSVRVDCDGCEPGPNGYAWTGTVWDNHQRLQVRGNSSATYHFDRSGTQFWSVTAGIRKEGPSGELRVSFLSVDGRVIRSDGTSQPGITVNISWPIQGDVYHLQPRAR